MLFYFDLFSAALQRFLPSNSLDFHGYAPQASQYARLATPTAIDCNKFKSVP
jgi:hypothetical protein